MPNCECIPRCAFFNDKMAGMPATADMMKKKYCLSGFNNCSRHRVLESLGREAVPVDLFPNQDSRADELISKKAA